MSLVPTTRCASILTILAAGVVYLLAGGFYVERGLVNSDEGFYAYASYAVIHGEVPYRDFAFTQMPVLPYVQGAIMSFTGFGVRQQRWISVCLGALSVALGATMWSRRKLHPVACWAMILAWCLCKPMIYYDTIGKTYALTGLLLLAAGGCLCFDFSPHLRLFLLSILGVLAVGCRLTVAPAILVLWLGLVVLHRKQISWPLLLGVPLTAALVILGPFFAADPSNAVFWNWTYHLQSSLLIHHSSILLASFTMSPGITVFAVVGLCAMALGRETMNQPGTWLFLAGLAGWLVSVGLSGVYADYAVPCWPLVVAGAGSRLCDVFPTRTKVTGACLVLISATVLGLFYGDSFIKKGYLESVDRAVRFVRANTRPTDVILASMPEIPLEAGRPVFPGLELGKFGLTSEMDDATAQSRRIITFNQLLRTVERQSVPVIVLSQFHAGNFAWSVPSLRSFTPEFYARFSELLLRRYDCVGADPYFLVFKVHDPQNHALKIDADKL